MAVLDYVLNRCTIREIDALEAAVERRRKDLTAGSGIISLDPARAARQMSETVNSSIGKSMDGIRKTFRTFAADMIRKEAPELTEEQMNELIESWLPKSMAFDAGSIAKSEQYQGLSRKGLVNGIPRDAMFEMITQFVNYSIGAMPLAEESVLRDEVGDWTALYWKKFPREIQELIKVFLSGAMTEDEFGGSLQAMLQ